MTPVQKKYLAILTAAITAEPTDWADIMKAFEGRVEIKNWLNVRDVLQWMINQSQIKRIPRADVEQYQTIPPVVPVVSPFTVSKPKMREHSRGVEWSCGLKQNGVVVANIFQAGKGGCDEYTWLDNAAIEAFGNAAEAYNKANGHNDWQKFYESGELSADYCFQYVEHLMQQAEYDARLAKDCKKMVCLRMPGQTDRQHSFIKNLIATPESVAMVKAKYPDAIILNPGYGEKK